MARQVLNPRRVDTQLQSRVNIETLDFNWLFDEDEDGKQNLMKMLAVLSR